MTPIRLLTAAAVSALIAAPAFAQEPAPAPADPTPMPAEQMTDSAMSPTDSANMPPPAADQAGMPASAVVRQSSPTPVEQAYTLKAGDPTVTSNAPVADTAENRAKYGSPISNGGKRTAPKGN